MFDMIDATGAGDKNDPRMRNVEAEMIRSHELCLKISSNVVVGGIPAKVIKKIEE